MTFVPSAVALLLALSALTSTAASLPEAMAACQAEQARQLPFSGFVAAGVGEARHRQAHGFADAQGQRRITEHTPFRLASLGKLFTQVAIGTLVDAGKLALHDPVRRHLPELPEAFSAITLAHLLDHRAGVAPMVRPAMADAPVMAAARLARDLVPVVAAKPLAFAAGAQQQYSNGGYLLLGAVVEAASGMPYQRYLEERLFAPLDMKSSGFQPGPSAAQPLTRLTAPGQPPAATPQPRIEFEALKATSAGDALSSAADMEAFAVALISDRLLTAATKAALFPRSAGVWRLGQAGGSVGSNTVLWVYPERGAWLLVLSNYDPPGGELMGQALSPVLEGQPCRLQPPRAMPMPPPGG